MKDQDQGKNNPPEPTSLEKSEKADFSRRDFIKTGSAAAMVAAVGSHIPFADLMPEGVQPIGLAHAAVGELMPGKTGEMIVLNSRPLNAEPPPYLLTDEITPAERMFVRNNGIPPVNPDAAAWTLTIDGEAVKNKTVFTLAELKKKFKTHTYHIQLECGGNGRSEYFPPAKGNQWMVGAVSCALWSGARLRDVLEYAGVKDNAVYIGYYGADSHISGDPKKVPISRGVPIAKAMESESLIAWQMNGQDIPLLHGYPLRLITGGWPASTSGKWLQRISIRDKVHDGPKMGGTAYRVPGTPVAPGTKVPNSDMVIINSMPVKSLINTPKSGLVLSLADELKVSGKAWAGDLAVKAMDVSIDFGSTWQSCDLKQPRNRLGWQTWDAKVKFPEKGYFEVWARATDVNGKMQPMVVPGWNPKGYLNNACHRVAVKVV